MPGISGSNLGVGMSVGMKFWQRFRNLKLRGEWVELKFMAEAAARGFSVSRPWGDSSAYDVGIELGQHFLRVQVKSTSYRRYAGYACHLDPRIRRGGYKLEEVDLFAIYVIPEDVWYVIPASAVLCPTPRTTVTLCPLTRTQKYRFRYERYRAAWGLLAKTKQELRRGKSCRT